MKFSADPVNSLLEVWLNDEQVLAGFPPLTVYQNAHRVGTTFDSVNG